MSQRTQTIAREIMRGGHAPRPDLLKPWAYWSLEIFQDWPNFRKRCGIQNVLRGPRTGTKTA